MVRKLPPFAAIKAFEAAARSCNFKLASKSLGITPSAVSHHVKTLEDYLGVKLFERKGNGLTLCKEGEFYYRELNVTLDRMEDATTRITRRHGQKELTLRLFPVLADLWIIPRLGEFVRKHPEIYLRLITWQPKETQWDVNIDLDIQYKKGTSNPHLEDYLFADELIPVCSPDYMNRHGLSPSSIDLSGTTLIFCKARPEEWPAWTEAFGVTLPEDILWLETDQRTATLNAAKADLGLAMGRRSYAEMDFPGGQLVTPFPYSMQTGSGYYLVRSQVTDELPEVKAFREWILGLCPPLQD